MPRSHVLSLLGLLGLLAACPVEIGDSCRTSLDCSPTGEWVCDLSVRDDGRGECTIEGCLADGCPDEAACIETFATSFLSVPCDPAREDRATCPDGSEDCSGAEALPPLDDCLPRETCLPEGLCADPATARTSCRRRCHDDGDCRDDYECRRTGTRGVYRAPDVDDPERESTIRVCMPRV